MLTPYLPNMFSANDMMFSANDMMFSLLYAYVGHRFWGVIMREMISKHVQLGYD